MNLFKRASEALFERQPLLGIDIGSSSIKLCQLRKTPKGLQLAKFDMATLPPETIVDGALMNPSAVVGKLKELIKANDFAHAKCALAVSGHSVIIKKISIPEMTADELAESIQWEAEQYIPFDIKDVYVDAQILNPKAGQGQMDVLLVAAKKDVINNYVSVVREAGLRPIVVDADTLACQNAFNLNYGCPPNEIIALINVGDSSININVISNGITTFTRDISMGGLLMTEEIMKQLNVSWKEAEFYKTGEISTGSSAVFHEIQKLIERVSEALVTEIQRSLDFFSACTINADIARIYLSGGASQPSAFIRALERRLEIPVELVNPFKNISIDTRKFDHNMLTRVSPVATVAVGLALRYEENAKSGGNDVRINLLKRKPSPSFFKAPKFPSTPLSISFRVPFSRKRYILSLSRY